MTSSCIRLLDVFEIKFHNFVFTVLGQTVLTNGLAVNHDIIMHYSVEIVCRIKFLRKIKTANVMNTPLAATGRFLCW